MHTRPGTADLYHLHHKRKTPYHKTVKVARCRVCGTTYGLGDEFKMMWGKEPGVCAICEEG